MKDLRIYCDGSRDDLGNLGVGIVFVSNNEVIKTFSYGLPFKGESYIAEFSAILIALSLINSYIENITICTDNVCAVGIVMGESGLSPKHAFLGPLSTLLKESVQNINCKRIRFEKVKSHSSDTFHNLADKWADEGRKSLIENE